MDIKTPLFPGMKVICTDVDGVGGRYYTKGKVYTLLKHGRNFVIPDSGLSGMGASWVIFDEDDDVEKYF